MLWQSLDLDHASAPPIILHVAIPLLFNYERSVLLVFQSFSEYVVLDVVVSSVYPYEEVNSGFSYYLPPAVFFSMLNYLW